LVHEDKSRFVDGKREDWIQVYEYEYALYEDGELIGVYESRRAAAEASLERATSQPFVIEQVRKDIQYVVLVSQFSKGIGPHID